MQAVCDVKAVPRYDLWVFAYGTVHRFTATTHVDDTLDVYHNGHENRLVYLFTFFVYDTKELGKLVTLAFCH